MSTSHSEPDRTLKQVDEYLTFFIAEVEYAVSLDHVREVIPYDTVTRVPGMPETVRGVTNLRGSVVPVIDLAIKFRLSAIEVTPRTCIVLVDTKLGDTTLLLGLLTEEVGQVLAMDRSQLLPPPPFGTPVHTDYLNGMLPLGKKFALVLNIDHALSEDEILAPPDFATDAAAPSIDVREDASDEALDDADWESAEASAAGERAAARS
ncbi:MAG TPA: chemotaxis protein CheW [Polyangiaceae bacterium]